MYSIRKQKNNIEIQKKKIARELKNQVNVPHIYNFVHAEYVKYVIYKIISLNMGLLSLNMISLYDNYYNQHCVVYNAIRSKKKLIKRFIFIKGIQHIISEAKVCT